MVHWISRIQERSIMKVILALLALVASISADAPGYGYAPEYYCRDTNTSIYAEVCVPAFAGQVTPVVLDVKEVVDEDYCFDEVLTVCEETTTVVEREICTYEYAREDVTAPCTTTQVTEPKQETCALAYPAPNKVCVTKSIEITEVICKDDVAQKCFNVAKFVDA